MKKITFVLLFIASFLLSNLNAQPKCEWAKGIYGSVCTHLYSIDFDDGGNIFVAGFFASQIIKFNDSIILRSDGDNDGCIAKYDSKGNTIWAKKISGPHTDQINSLVYDRNNNLYVAGEFYSKTLTFNNEIKLNRIGEFDGFIAKYDTSGTCIWARLISGNSSDRITKLAMDRNGLIYFSGYTNSNSVSFNDSIILSKAQGADGFVGKIDSDGNFLWAELISGEGGSTTLDIAVDRSLNFYVLGIFDSGKILFNNNKELSIQGGSINSDGFIAKYNSEGICQWAEKISGNDLDIPRKLVLEEKSLNEKKTNQIQYLETNLYITGSFRSNTLSFNNGISLPISGKIMTFDSFLAKYNSDGICQWAVPVTGEDRDEAYRIAIDKNRNIYISGWSFSNIIRFNDDIILTNASEDNGDIFFAKYNTDGNCIWAEKISGIKYEFSFDMLVDYNDNIYISGSFMSDTVFFNNGINIILPSNSQISSFIAKYSNESSYIADNTIRDNINIFPNPVLDVATINCNYQNSDNLKLSITNLIGEKVKEVLLFSPTNNHVNLSELSGGIYIFTISGNGFSESKIVSVIK